MAAWQRVQLLGDIIYFTGHCLYLLYVAAQIYTLFSCIEEGVDRGGGGTGIEGAESGVEGAESGVEGAGSGSRGGGKRGHCGRGYGKIGGQNCFFFTRKFIKKMIHNDTL